MTRSRQPGAESTDSPLPRRRPGTHLPAASILNGGLGYRPRTPGARILFTGQGLVKFDPLAVIPADISDDTVLLRIRAALEGLP